MAHIMFKVRHSIIPEFLNKKGKDSIMALDSIKRFDNLTSTNNWSETAASNSFANALHRSANEWLFSVTDMYGYKQDQLT
jgi:hypothetical protein